MTNDRARLPLRQPLTLPWLTWLVFATAVLVWSLAHGEAPVAGQYETGYPSLVKIAADLHQALDPKLRSQFAPEPLLLDQVPAPRVEPVFRTEGGRQLCAVQVSAGFIQLLSFLSHAKAIDGVDRGFYKRSITSLAVQSGETGLPDLRITHAQAWSFDTMNHQVSHFNQMAGTLLAIQMAHHRLGHYQKYASRLTDAQGRPVPIASLVTPQEWQDAVIKGVNHALKCGFGVDGLRFLYEGLEKMPSRPPWTLCLLPATANVSKLNKQLARAENDFFLVSDAGRDL